MGTNLTFLIRLLGKKKGIPTLQTYKVGGQEKDFAHPTDFFASNI